MTPLRSGRLRWGQSVGVVWNLVLHVAMGGILVLWSDGKKRVLVEPRPPR